MGLLQIAGLGPGGWETLTAETMQAIEQADKVILRTEVHPAAAGLKAKGIPFVTCDRYYESGASFQQIYESIADYVYGEAVNGGSVCYCLPGHPLVAEETVKLIRQKKADTVQGDISPEIRILPALSFLDSAFVALGIDPVSERLSVLDAAALWQGDRSGLLPLPDGASLVAQVYDQLIAGELKLALLENLPPEAEVIILYHTGIKGEEELLRCPLAELDHYKRFDHLTSVYIPCRMADKKRDLPRAEGQAADYPLDQLVGVFRRLLGPGGCPWDQKQTHESLKPYLLEEANEALEAIDEKDMAHLQEELGDVLMQIVFHCVLAEKRGDFDVNDVITGITEKMIRRHPHVFGDEKAENPEEVMVIWQKVKEGEKEKKKEKEKE